MAFQIFDAYGAASRPEATLRASGYLFLSKGILKRAGDEHAKYCQVLFDEENSLLGIKLIDSGTSDLAAAAGVKEMMIEKSGASVNLVPLMKFYGIPKRKDKTVLEVKFDEGLIVIPISALKSGGGSSQQS